MAIWNKDLNLEEINKFKPKNDPEHIDIKITDYTDDELIGNNAS